MPNFETKPKNRPGAIKNADSPEETNPKGPTTDKEKPTMNAQGPSQFDVSKRSADPATCCGHPPRRNAQWPKHSRDADFTILNSPFAIPPHVITDNCPCGAEILSGRRSGLEEMIHHLVNRPTIFCLQYVRNN